MADLVSLNAHNLSLVYNLSRLGVEMDDVALYFGVSKKQFDNLCETHPEFLRAYDEGKSVRDKINNADYSDG